MMITAVILSVVMLSVKLVLEMLSDVDIACPNTIMPTVVILSVPMPTAVMMSVVMLTV